MKEILKDSYIFPDNYLVGNYGSVYNKKTGRKRNPSTDKDGYFYLKLHNNGEEKFMRLNRLVALTFINNPNNLPVVNHLDGDKKNNYVENLEWTTVKENAIHSYENGLQKGAKGSKHSRAKFTDNQIIKVCEMLQSGVYTNLHISETTGVSVRTIQSVRSRYNWTHISKDYVFSCRRNKPKIK